MRVTPLLASLVLTSLVLASALSATAPVVAQDAAQDQDIVRSEELPRGDRWEDRWRGRRHILYDEVWQDSTDGHASELKQDCRTFVLRHRRPDGTTAVRRENRCD